MTTVRFPDDKPATREPEPVDAEFEPASPPQRLPPRSRRKAPAARRSRSVTLAELGLGCAVAAMLGAGIAIAVTGADSGATNGTLAQEIDALARAQTDFAVRSKQLDAELVSIRGRLDAQDGRLDAASVDEEATRQELSTLVAQVSALIGAPQAPGTSPSSSPLEALLARISRLEGALADDAAGPRTTPQMQRVVRDLSGKVAALDEANARLAAALNRRQIAMTALENGLLAMSAEVGALRDRPRTEGPRLTPVIAAAAESQAVRALSALETAANAGRPFDSQLRALATLVPDDPDIAFLGEIATRGAPAHDQLRRDFADAVRHAGIGAEGRAVADEMDDGWDWLRATTAGDPLALRTPANAAIDALVRQARLALDAGDVRGALEAVDAMPGAPAGPFRSWRRQALRRAQLDAGLAALEARLLTPAPDGG